MAIGIRLKIDSSGLQVKLHKNSRNSFQKMLSMSLFRLVQGLVLFIYRDIERSEDIEGY